MKPMPLMANEIWDRADHLIVGPPPGSDDSILSVDACVDKVGVVSDGDVVECPRWNIKIQVSKEDIEALVDHPYFWVSFLSPRLVPFNVALMPEGVERVVPGQERPDVSHIDPRIDPINGHEQD